MGTKVYKIFEYLYLVMALLSISVVYKAWPEDKNRAYLFAFFTVVAIFMFFFKRNFRKKLEGKNNQD